MEPRNKRGKDLRKTSTRRRTSAGSPDNAPTIRRFRSGFRWDGVLLEPYKPGSHRDGQFRGASRQVLIGRNDESVRFHVRYFELAPGGFTTLERHRHSHVVIGIRGRGRVRMGDRHYTIGRLDTVYISPGQPHQLAAAGRGAFGFFCIVDARRDRPRAVVEKPPRRASPPKAGAATKRKRRPS